MATERLCTVPGVTYSIGSSVVSLCCIGVIYAHSSVLACMTHTHTQLYMYIAPKSVCYCLQLMNDLFFEATSDVECRFINQAFIVLPLQVHSLGRYACSSCVYTHTHTLCVYIWVHCSIWWNAWDICGHSFAACIRCDPFRIILWYLLIWPSCNLSSIFCRRA